MRMERLELSRNFSLDPKSSASTFTPHPLKLDNILIIIFNLLIYSYFKILLYINI